MIRVRMTKAVLMTLPQNTFILSGIIGEDDLSLFSGNVEDSFEERQNQWALFKELNLNGRCFYID